MPVFVLGLAWQRDFYRQQITLRDYSLLLDTTWLGYSYSGSRNRLRVQTLFNVAMLGSSLLFWTLAGGFDRVKLWSQLGLCGSYEFRQRNYQQPDYRSLSGQTHTAQLELKARRHPIR